MAYTIVKKKLSRGRYLYYKYKVHSVREGRRVRQIIDEYLGRCNAHGTPTEQPTTREIRQEAGSRKIGLAEYFANTNDSYHNENDRYTPRLSENNKDDYWSTSRGKEAIEKKNVVKKLLKKEYTYTDLKQAFSVSDNYDTKVDVSVHSWGRDGEVHVNGVIKSKEGRNIGDFSREIKKGRDGDLEAYHSSFFIHHKDDQGKGIGKELFRNMIPFYDKIGVKKVTVFADGDGGYYAWMKYGFDFDDKDIIKEHREKFGQYAAMKLAGYRSWDDYENDEGYTSARFKKYEKAKKEIMPIVDKYEHSWDLALGRFTAGNKEVTGKQYVYDYDNYFPQGWHGTLDLSKRSVNRKQVDAYIAINAVRRNRRRTA